MGGRRREDGERGEGQRTGGREGKEKSSKEGGLCYEARLFGPPTPGRTHSFLSRRVKSVENIVFGPFSLAPMNWL